MKSIQEYLDEDYIKWRDKPYITCKKEGRYSTKSFKETIDDVRNIANSLIEAGLKELYVRPDIPGGRIK